jgi:hypothetical protein
MLRREATRLPLAFNVKDLKNELDDKFGDVRKTSASQDGAQEQLLEPVTPPSMQSVYTATAAASAQRQQQTARDRIGYY